MNLSFRKRRDWLSNFARFVDSSVPKKQVQDLFYNELAKAPYAGMFIFYLLFEEYTDDADLAKAALKNVRTPFDYLAHMYLMDEDVDPVLYYDVNRVIKMKDKFESYESTLVLDQVIENLLEVAQ